MDARDVPVVELNELELCPRSPGSVVVRLEERFGSREAVPDQRTDQRTELALGIRTYPDDSIPLVEHDERRGFSAP